MTGEAASWVIVARPVSDAVRDDERLAAESAPPDIV
jgi:hypothetical protein